jgi:hypothetical protein
MRTFHFNSTCMRAGRRVVRTAVLCTLGACIGDNRATAPATVASMRVYLTASVVEPLDVVYILIDAHDAEDRSVTLRSSSASWTSSDQAVASVAGGYLATHAPGDVTVTGTYQGASASMVVHVGWRPETRLTIGSLGTAVEAGSRVVFSPTVVTTTRRQILAADVAWSSSNSTVASIQAPGQLVALSPGTTTVVARFLGLADSVTVQISPGSGGFGYFYSGDAYADDYDDTFWTPPPGMSFSTSQWPVSATWGPPYPDRPDLGWTGPGSPARDALLHVVSLEKLRCTAYVQPDSGYLFVIPGGPLVECGDWTPTSYRGSVRMEFLAFRPTEFTGTFGLVRPGFPLVSTNTGGIIEIPATAGSRAFAMPGVARDSTFWFVTPGAWNIASCALASSYIGNPPNAVQIICGRVMAGPFEPLFYAVGFGADARHGTAPIGFAEVRSDGVVTRKRLDGLDIAITRSSNGVIEAVVSGERLTAFDRVPGVLLSAIAPIPLTCALTGPVRDTAARVKLNVTCPDGVSGFTLGIVY